MTKISDVLLLARHVSIVHHIPGRIRLRVSPSGVALASGLDLNQLIDCIPGVIGIRVNALVGSIVIEYDPDRLSPDLWEAMARSNGDPESVSEIEGRLAMVWKC
ncbi:MAG: HMA2 domain-containing protein [Syntrophobacteraceae bacterium]